MKKVLFFACAAAMLAACSNTDELATLQNVQNAQGTEVNFDVYASRTTRAGLPGGFATPNYGVTLTSLKTGQHKDAGFGVFGYYSSNSEYDANSSTPNFMYNQPVTWSGSVWTYSPVKYWPNEYGTGANSDDVDRVSFFAYAPFTDVTYSTGVPVAKTVVTTVTDPETEISEADALTLLGATEATKADWETNHPGLDFQATLNDQVQNLNITQLNKNTQTGDPIVKYVVDTKPSTSVDLLWGVAADGTLTLGNDYVGEDGKTVKGGSCFVDLTKQNDVTKKVNWNFKHALAAINVQIVAAVDDVTQPANYDPTTTPSKEIGTEGDGTVDNWTGVFVRSISFNGFAMKGALDLYSDDVNSVADAQPKWKAYDGNNDLQFETVTFYDGLKDGKEGTENNIQKSEGISLLNPDLLQASSKEVAGVWRLQGQGILPTKDKGIPHNQFINLFDGANGDATAPIYVIPSGEQLDIQLAYDVETIDENLYGLLSDNVAHGSNIENIIYKTDVLSGATMPTIEAGYTYTIKIIVGLESVKFDVEVTPWDETTPDSQIGLPENH